ncbi:hypothetical protein JCM3766R1_003630 [Sporobolomyces carnicolor]
MPRPRSFLRPWPQPRSYSTNRVSPSSTALQRELFRRVAQPVAVLTAHIPRGPETDATADSRQPGSVGSARHNYGATLSSLTSISLSPPLVSFSLRLPSRLANHLSASPSHDEEPRSFRVYLLSPAQEDLARLFARQAPLPAPAVPSPETNWAVEPKFDAAVFERLETDPKVLGWMDCKVVERVNLWEIGQQRRPGRAVPDRSSPEEEEDVAKTTMRSQLFIASVDEVKLGENGEGKGSLVWAEQNYRSISA